MKPVVQYKRLQTMWPSTFFNLMQIFNADSSAPHAALNTQTFFTNHHSSTLVALLRTFDSHIYYLIVEYLIYSISISLTTLSPRHKQSTKFWMNWRSIELRAAILNRWCWLPLEFHAPRLIKVQTKTKQKFVCCVCFDNFKTTTQKNTCWNAHCQPRAIPW